MDCKKDKNKISCGCTYSSCEKQGICCECISFHKRMNELPGCLFPPDAERTYDRSVRKFVEAVTKNGYKLG
jgi:hypothetical protein